MRAEQEQNQYCLEAERLAEREQLEREQDALREQWLKQFQSLTVSSIFFLQSIIINVVLNQFDEPNLNEDVEQRPSGLSSRSCHLTKRYHDEPPLYQSLCQLP